MRQAVERPNAKAQTLGAYKKALKLFHPDKNHGKPLGTRLIPLEAFKLVRDSHAAFTARQEQPPSRRRPETVRVETPPAARRGAARRGAGRGRAGPGAGRPPGRREGGRGRAGPGRTASDLGSAAGCTATLIACLDANTKTELDSTRLGVCVREGGKAGARGG